MAMSIRGFTSQQLISASAAAALALATLWGLSACAAESSQSPTSTTPTTPTASAIASPSSSSSATPTATTEVSTPIKAGCSTLLSDDVLAKSYPGYELNKSYSVAAGSFGATAVSEQGVACQWTNPDTGLAITVSAAHLGNSALKTMAGNLTGTPTSEYSAEANSKGTFQIANGSGTAQLVTSKFWITAESGEFYSSVDAVSVMSTVLAALEWDANN